MIPLLLPLPLIIGELAPSPSIVTPTMEERLRFDPSLAFMPGLAGLAGKTDAAASPPTAGISFVGSKVGNYVANTNQSYSLTDLKDESGANATLLQDDIVVLTFHTSGGDRSQASLMPQTADYTAAHADIFSNDINQTNFQVSYKIMGATPDTTILLPGGGTTAQGKTFTLFALRGVDTTNPLDVAAVLTQGGNSGQANPGSITPSTPGAVISVHGGASGTLGAFAQPADLSELTNHWCNTSRNTTNSSQVASGLKFDWTSGAFDCGSFGGSTSTNSAWGAVTLAWRPA